MQSNTFIFKHAFFASKLRRKKHFEKMQFCTRFGVFDMHIKATEYN